MINTGKSVYANSKHFLGLYNNTLRLETVNVAQSTSNSK